MYKMIIGALAVASLMGCSQQPASQETVQQWPVQMPALSDAGQASCAMAGGVQSVARLLDGSLEGVCALPNGKRCGDQALAAGGCG